MYKLVFFVPDTHKELVKEAIFNAGAGHFDGYDCCSWETQGMGQFRPLDNSQPFIGENGKLEQVNEYRVETICSNETIKTVVSALKLAHPYEEPAYQYWPVNQEDF
ncbi:MULTISPECIES: NGG1p interacting factor NIF3 [unclassified Methylophaga]|uniref:NGG1p interacting factor NIF3 n=1 Tax=unclassified Methylophaga TaxID=2629249 RepID=UPI000C0F37A1|nr:MULTISPECIES: NGG1p interacting factor NIF3 [unclassified Methylophaga]MBL1458351.1 NGG1p interacting factor NIF3 [Methylophaga sp.]